MTKPKWVCGFLFDNTLSEVVLIQKNRGPQFLHGKLNGVGGQVEEGEEPLQAMRREFKEETGLQVLYWTPFCDLNTAGGTIRFYWAIGKTQECWTQTDEAIHVLSTELVDYDGDMVPNIRWLVPMALSMIEGDDPTPFFQVSETT